MAATDKTIDQLDPGNAAVGTDILPIERGGLNYFLTISAISTFVNANLNAVQSITVDSTIIKSGTGTNPALAVNTGTNEGQIPVLGDAVKNLAALSNLIYGGQLAMTDPQAPHDAKPIDQVAAELLALIQAAGGVTGINNGTDTATGLVQLLAGSNVTITKHPTIANAFVIAATGGGGSGGVTTLNGIAGALKILPGLNVIVDTDPVTGEITIGVQNVNNAATYVDAVIDASASPISATYQNGNAGVGATLTANGNGAFPAVDGVTLPQGKRIAYIKDASNPSYHGLYTLTDAGSASSRFVLTRASDFDTVDTMLSGTAFTILQGDSYGGGQIVFAEITGNPPVVGTDSIIFNFIPSLAQVVKQAITTPGAALDLEMSADTVLTANPIPAVVIAQPLANGLTLTLPDFSGQTRILSVGQKFAVINVNQNNTEYSLDVLDHAGNLLTTLNPLDMVNFIVQDISASPGELLAEPKLLFLISAKGNIITGVKILNTDDIEQKPDAVKQFLPSTASSVAGQIVQSNGPGQPATWVEPQTQGTKPLQAVWDWSTTPGLTLTYNNGNQGAGATLTNSVNGVLPEIDQMSLAIDDRLVLVNHSSPRLNGIYDITDLGSATSQFVITRASDFDTGGKMNPGVVFVVNNSGERSGPGLFTGSLVSLAFEVIQVGVDPIYFNVNPAFGTNPVNYEVSALVDNRHLSPNQDVANLADGTVSNQEFQYLNGVTGGIQVQINSKMNSNAVIPIAQGGTGQTTRQQALNALVGAVTKGALVYGDGTNINLLAPGAEGYILTLDANGNLIWTLDPVTPDEFTWTPTFFDPTIIPLTATGRGFKDGNRISLYFVLRLPPNSSMNYIQFNGWNPSIAPPNTWWQGNTVSYGATAAPNGYPSQCMFLVDRIGLLHQGVPNQFSDVDDSLTISGNIDWFIDDMAARKFSRALRDGKISFDAEIAELHDKTLSEAITRTFSK